MLNANAILWRVFRFSVSGDMRKEPPPLATVFCSHRFQPNYSRGLCDEKEENEYVPTSQLLPVGDGLLKALFDAPHTGRSRIAEHPHELSKSPPRTLLRAASGLPWPPDACPLDNAQQFWKGCLREVLLGEKRGQRRLLFSGQLTNCNEIYPNICYNMWKFIFEKAGEDFL